MDKNIKTILNLFSAYFNETISESQYNELKQWLNKSAENKKLFTDYLHIHKKSKRIGLSMQIDKDEAWNNIIGQVKHPILLKSDSKVHIFKPIFSLLKYAAVFVGVLGLSYFFIKKDNIDVIDNDQLVIAEENIILELENGNLKIIDVNGDEKIIDKSGKIIKTKKAPNIGCFFA